MTIDLMTLQYSIRYDTGYAMTLKAHNTMAKINSKSIKSI